MARLLRSETDCLIKLDSKVNEITEKHQKTFTEMNNFFTETQKNVHARKGIELTKELAEEMDDSLRTIKKETGRLAVRQ